MRPLVLFGLVLLTLPARAQTVYDRPAGGVLRYREVTEGEITTTIPSGPSTVRTYHDGTVRLTFGAGDAATAQFDTLAVGLVAEGGTVAPDASGALGLTYRLRFPANGRVETAEVPAFPEAVGEVTDLRMQFVDFFLPLPATRLAVGVAWADSIAHRNVDPGAETVTFRTRTRYRVVSDTTVGGVAAVVVAAESDVRSDATNLDGDPTAGVELRGVERGRFVFAPAAGRLLERRRSADLAGHVRIGSGDEAVKLPQRFHYTSRITLVD